jgi:hypothetical protein
MLKLDVQSFVFLIFLFSVSSSSAGKKSFCCADFLLHNSAVFFLGLDFLFNSNCPSVSPLLATQLSPRERTAHFCVTKTLHEFPTTAETGSRDVVTPGLRLL